MKLKTNLLLLLVLAGTTLFAQNNPFTATNAWLSDNNLKVVLSGDFNNNGLKDVIASGTDGILHLYTNNGDGTFTLDNNASFRNLSTVSCADLNNDGRLDIIITGNAGSSANPSYHTYVYTNDGNGSFSENEINNVPGLVDGNISLVDYNNDGKTDFLLSGQNEQGVVSTTLYKNNGNLSFSAVSAKFTGVRYGSSSWGDYNNDGFEDLLLTGQHVAADGTFTPTAEVYKNNGDGTFTLQSNISLSGIDEGVGKWGDYDNDGDLDILIAGDYNGASGWVYKIYNNNKGVFSEADSLTFNKYNTIQWGDFNNDGYLDLFYAGQTWNDTTSEWVPRASLMMYSGSTHTYDSIDLKLDTLIVNGVSSHIISVDTSDNLDIYVSGYDSAGQQQSMLLMNTSDTNNRPTAPKHLTVKQKNREMILNWDSATDVETNAKSLTYNLRIGTKPGGDDIFSPGSDSATGNQLKFESGRIRKVDSGYIVNIPPGKYYWSIQTVDGGFKTSPFATGDSLVVDSTYYNPMPPVNLTTKTISEHILKLSWDYQYDDAKSFIIERSDSTNDNFDSIAAVNDSLYSYQDDSLIPGTKYYYRIKTSNGDTVSSYSDTIVGTTWPVPLLSKVTDGAIVNEDYSSTGAAWGDYNNDGYLDLAVTNSNHPTEIFTNNGNGTFTKTEPDSSSVGDATGVSWVDVNNDGYLDLFITQGQGYHNLLYINNQDGAFTKDTSTILTQSTAGSSAAAWADYNKDSLVDVFICGLDSANRLYKNLGNGKYQVVKLEGDSTMNHSLGCNWVDYNNDGHIDLFVANYGKPNYLYENIGDSAFKLITTGEIATDSEESSSGTWGDFNNDGYPDLFVAVNANSDNILYINNGDGTFTRDSIWPFANRGYGYTGGNGASWQDVNNDGNLDLFIAGSNGNQLYMNNGDGTFTKKTNEPYCYDYGYSMAAVWGDYNNDGNIDLFIPNDYNQPNLLYRNNGYPPHESSLKAQALENNRVMIRLKGVKSNSFGLGAKVVIKSGSRTYERVITTQSGAFSSVNGLIASVGIGQNTSASATIYWPSGIVQDVSSIKLNQVNVIQETSGTTGVSSIQYVKTDVKVFPNPTKDYLNIKLDDNAGNGKIEVKDVFGKTVKKVSFDNANGENIRLNVSNLEDGIYLLNIEFGTVNVTKKFIKIR